MDLQFINACLHGVEMAVVLQARAGAKAIGLRRLFTEHPASLGETYTEHRRVALSYAGPLAAAALAALCHAVFPFLFKTTASMIVKQLNDRIAGRCRACPSGRAHRPDLFADDASPKPAI